jgi:predicted ATPase
MEGKRLLRSIRLENILSYGPDGESFELEPLNVLIGANASGKSNLLEILALLAAAPRSLPEPIRQGGGTTEWLWKGARDFPTASIELLLEPLRGPRPIRYQLAFTAVGGRFELTDERIENDEPLPGHDQPYLYYAYQEGRPVLNVFSASGGDEGDEGPQTRHLKREDVSPEQSILSQRRDVDLYPELTRVAQQLGAIRFFREWNLGRSTAPRLPQKVDLPEDFLLEDGSNLGLVLNHLLNDPGRKDLFLGHLRSLYEGVRDVTTLLQGGTVQVFFHEEGLRRPIPATRLSDGTLRFLCLLTILCHPKPPQLICLEEPELGLHPDAVTALGELLIDASRQTQLLVTTHSDVLVSALSEVPEAVVVAERDEAGTHLRRLDPAHLEQWLEKYRLGEIWQMGELGGTRW